ncbi:4-aminobutyrate--2-oxoglutarate transaminase [Celerinatantimonas diazotrophica]|uniref:4-aminobutyrate aminotransferase/(S)-3-amino-2-methylpropionate transaminase n=1 Tax=Celerinatantimonas diazotrophica TaxID=412034 RepID=A0A4R1J9Y9_9GAMM|nr:4-aminobutyrate--2-oxoglutarate transaminase [Celerinatantimonas diazotrophica]TCK47432.1 4-aminobutyrate aminotransferase/(S)-3-amino-2-methylpropionate transaminase [Celerinatantimonas diazotrophica]CAG9294950.1 5-aminovalerate aminotransferase DavT [Celerinatantimonas diazotrophica]
MTNQELAQRRQQAFAAGQSNAFDIFIDRAENAQYWDTEGNRYIDLGAGIAVLNTGHRHPKVLAAVKEQLEHVTHTCMTVTPYAPAVELAEKLNQLAPGPSRKKTALFSSGSEAIENAIKIARHYTKRSGVIAFDGGFHGRTAMAMALTGKVNPYKKGFGPFPAEIYHVPYPNAYLGISEHQAIEAIETRFKVDIEPERVAAIVVEPVQGEGGFYRAPASFLKALRQLCDQHGIVLIIDEIQSGFARTGKLFACEYAEVEPDLMTIAKGLGGGFPLSGVVGKAEIMDSPQPGGLGGTYGGSPIACAAALAVLEVIDEEQLCERALSIGEQLTGRLNNLQQRHPALIGDVRHLGAMVAFELVHDGDAQRPNPELTKAIVAESAKKGLILLSCGTRGNVIRLLPALTAPVEILDEAMDILSDVMASLA